MPGLTRLEGKYQIRGIQKLPGVKAKHLILMNLYRAGKDGLSQKDLAEKSTLNRDTVYEECKRLEREGFIRIETRGRRTSYYPTSKIFNEFFLYSWIVGKDLFSKINNKHLYVTSKDNTRNIRTSLVDYKSSPYYETKFSGTNDGLEQLLFTYSVRIGAVITYLLIQAMNPLTIRQLIYDEKINASRQIKDHFIENWVKNIISPVELLNALRKYFADPGHNITIENATKFSMISKYELPNKTITEIVKAFASLYPNVYRELDNTYHELPYKIEKHRKAASQALCKHEYSMSHKNKGKQFECSKCKHKITVSFSSLEHGEEVISKLNKIRPPANPNKSCVKFGHQWEIFGGYHIDCIVYVCALCRNTVSIPGEDERRLVKIEKDVSSGLGRNAMSFCNDLKYFFYVNFDKRVTIDDFIRFYEEMKPSLKIDRKELFIETVTDLLDILVRNGYVNEVSSHDNHHKRFFVKERILDFNRAF